MTEMTIKGDEKKIKQLRKELKYRLKHDKLILKDNVEINDVVKKKEPVKKVAKKSTKK